MTSKAGLDPTPGRQGVDYMVGASLKNLVVRESVESDIDRLESDEVRFRYSNEVDFPKSVFLKPTTSFIYVLRTSIDLEFVA